MDDSNKYFLWGECQNCGAEILDSSLKCGYCETVHIQKFTFSEEELEFLKKYAEELTMMIYRKDFYNFPILKAVTYLFISPILSIVSYLIVGDFIFSFYLCLITLFPMGLISYYRRELYDSYPPNLKKFRKEVLIPKINQDLKKMKMDYLYFQEYLFYFLKDKSNFSHHSLSDLLYEQNS